MPNHTGVVVEIKREAGLLFCKDLKRFIKYDVRKEHWNIGQGVKFDITEHEDGSITLSNKMKTTYTYLSEKNIIKPVVKVKVQTSEKASPFRNIGFNDFFGDILIPRSAHDIEDGDEVYLKIQFCDFFVDGFFWIGIEWSEDGKHFEKFDENLEFKHQSFFIHHDERKIKKQRKKSVQNENDRNVETPMSCASSNANESQTGVRTTKKGPLVSSCLLEFEFFDVINMKTKTFTEKHPSDPNYYKYTMIIKLEKEYAIGFLCADPDILVIVPKTAFNYEPLVQVGAIVEIEALNIIMKEGKNKDTPFSFCALHVFEYSQVAHNLTPMEKNKFIFEVVFYSEDLNINEPAEVSGSKDEKILESHIGPILFKPPAWKELQRFSQTTDNKFKFRCQFMRNHKSRCCWIASAKNFKEVIPPPTNPINQNSAAQNDNFGMNV